MAEVFGIVTAAIGTVDIFVNRLEGLAQRYDNFSSNPGRLQGLQSDYRLVRNQLRRVRSMLENTGQCLSDEARRNFSDSVSAIEARMMASDSILQNLEAILPVSGASPMFQVLRSAKTRLSRWAKANKISHCIDSLEKCTELVNVRLDVLTGFLDSAERHDSRGRAREESADIFSPRFEVPAMPRHIVLDFNTRDSSGYPVSMEGKLKDALVWAIKTSTTRAAAAVGVAGMGGVGKTSALIGLGREEDLRKEFSGGIYFLSIGQDAKPGDVVKEIARIIRASGGLKLAERIVETETLKDVVSAAAQWFAGRPCLFLFDDLWESDNSTSGYLDNLRQLLSTCGESGMVISTRSRVIARDAGDAVDFGPRDPIGRESRNILFEYAKVSDDVSACSSECQQAVEQVLSRCGGIPFTLAVAGRAIRIMTADCAGDWKSAVVIYARILEDDCSSLTGESIGTYPNFNATIRASLGIGDRWVNRNEVRQRVGSVDSLSGLLLRMSVLKKQARVPMCMLKRLWGLQDERQVSLVVEKLADLSLVVRQQGRMGQFVVGLHDLVLEFCRREARNNLQTYHRALLNEYLKTEIERTNSVLEVGGSNVSLSLPVDSADSMGWTVRPWWSDRVSDDGYIYDNLARHLVASDNIAELCEMLTDIRWTILRLRSGGLAAWNNDFDELLSAKKKSVTSRAGGEGVARQGERLVRDAVREAWAFIVVNPTELPFQVHARLADVNECAVQRYLESVRKWALKPWLRPMKRCWQVPGGRLQMEIDLGSTVAGVALTNYSQSAVTAVGRNVVVVNLETCAVTLTLEGHSDDVNCVAISGDDCYTVSGSDDRTLRIWNIKNGQAVGEPLQGHSGCVNCVAISADGQRIVSGSDDWSLRIWNMKDWEAVGEPLYICNMSSVRCVAISVDGQHIVSGSDDRKLRIWDMEARRVVGWPLRGHWGSVCCVAISPDGRHIVSGSDDSVLRIWEMESGEELHELQHGNSDDVWCVSISADGRYIVSGSSDEMLRIFSMESEKVVCEAWHGHGGSVKCVAISADSHHIASGSDDKTLRIWNVDSEEVVNERPRGHSDYIWCVAISADCGRIVSGSDDKTLRIWDMENGEAVGGPLRGHTDNVSCVAFSADGQRIVSGSYDQTLRVWDIETGNAVGEPLRGHTGCICRIDISAENEVTSHAVEKLCWRFDDNHGLVRLEDTEICQESDDENDMAGDEKDGPLLIDRRLVKLASTDTVLATLPAEVGGFATNRSWCFDQGRGVLVTGLQNGDLFCHKLVMDP